jgi:hypothetical protein
MDYIDWIISSGIFFLVIVGVLAFLPNYMPINRINYDSITASNIFNSITDVVPSYSIVNAAGDGEIYPYFVNLNSNLGRGDSTSVVDSNVAFGLVYDKSSFYNFDANTDFNSAKTRILNESFDDYNYLDTFTLNSGTPSITNGRLDVYNISISTTNNYSDYYATLITDANDLNVYFNYLDADNTFLCKISSAGAVLSEIDAGSTTTINTIVLAKSATWRKIGFGYSDKNIVSCSIDGTSVSASKAYATTRKIKINGINSSSQIDDFIIYKNNNLVSVSSTKTVDTSTLNASITVATADMTLFKGDAVTANFNMVFDSALSVEDTNNISILRNPLSVKRMIFFPQVKEFWAYILSTGTITISLDTNLFIDGNYLDQGYESIKLKRTEGAETRYVMINVFDVYGNKQECNFYSAAPNTIVVHDCQTNSYLKFRFRDDSIATEYPNINIIKSKERIITPEKVSALEDSNSYYLSLTNGITVSEKGVDRETYSKLYENYSYYLSNEGIKEMVKVLIRPN